MKHTMPAHLLQRRAIRVVVVGCGGNGSVMAMGLPYIHQALLLSGHAGGLDVTLIDGDVVSPTNCVRQPFSQSEIGLSKSVVLASRINLFWGLQWKAIQGARVQVAKGRGL
jgi:PRTRC genetic system ThiF family protein